MNHIWRLLSLGLFMVGIFLPIPAVLSRPPSQSDTTIVVQMYILFDDGSSTGSLCYEGSTDYGCTAFDRDHYPPAQVRPYLYKANPATVSIEDDYLLDVVPREMGPSGHHPLALRAQAIAARTYAYCAIHAWEQQGGEGEGTYWGNCLREIDNSNSFQVFVPYHFDTLTSDDQQAIQNAVVEVVYLSDADDADRGPIFAEFSADAYLETLPGDYTYLQGVKDPISYDQAIPGIISATGAHQRGMSQNGANRWAYGNSSQYGAGDPWSVRWADYRQILAHYYTGIHLRDTEGSIFTPDDRWNLLEHAIPTTMLAGEVSLATVQVQNTSTEDWYDNVVLGWQWTAPEATPDPGGEWEGGLPLAVTQGATSMSTVAITAPAVGGTYALHLDVGRTRSPEAAEKPGGQHELPYRLREK